MLALAIACRTTPPRHRRTAHARDESSQGLCIERNLEPTHSPTIAVAAHLHVPTTNSDCHRVDSLATTHGVHVEFSDSRGAERDAAQINLLIFEQRPQLIPPEHAGRVPNVVQ